MKFKNKLANETSPYLLQHANNPVDWFPWGNEALDKAKSENKLLLISIGYAACHWCHVMEHESFEDASVAQVMNDFYVSIKVDREERPDVDQIYMDAAHLITGRGGWPLNVIALPDGRPVFAVTYFRKNEWIKILLYFKDLYQKEPENYTWWDMVTRARDRNVGWRIDYFYISENLKDNIKSAIIHSSVMGSDHCPVEIQLKF